MFETVSTEEALKKGQRMINMPVTFIMLGSLSTSIILVMLQNGYGLLARIIAISGFIASWLYWSFAITRWKVWAFDNVRNVHDLKKRAIAEKLIWSDGSVWNKTEIWKATDKQKWTSLQAKFNEPDIFMNDLSVSPEVMVYFSKSKGFVQLMLMAGLALFGVYSLLSRKQLVFGGFMTGLGVIMGTIAYLRIRNRKPQIILNNQGIQTASIQFYEWGEISAEDVEISASGKSRTCKLVYHHPKGRANIDISEYDISKEELEHHLRVFRARYENSTAVKQHS